MFVVGIDVLPFYQLCWVLYLPVQLLRTFSPCARLEGGLDSDLNAQQMDMFNKICKGINKNIHPRVCDWRSQGG